MLGLSFHLSKTCCAAPAVDVNRHGFFIEAVELQQRLGPVNWDVPHFPAATAKRLFLFRLRLPHLYPHFVDLPARGFI